MLRMAMNKLRRIYLRTESVSNIRAKNLLHLADLAQNDLKMFYEDFHPSQKLVNHLLKRYPTVIKFIQPNLSLVILSNQEMRQKHHDLSLNGKKRFHIYR